MNEDVECFVMVARVPGPRKRRSPRWFPYAVAYLAFVIFVGIITFFARPAHAEGRHQKRRGEQMQCYYVRSSLTQTVGTSCYRSRAVCEDQLQLFTSILGSVEPGEHCFRSHETELFIVDVGDYRHREVFPNRASCLDARQFFINSGDKPTVCQPTPARRYR